MAASKIIILGTVALTALWVSGCKKPVTKAEAPVETTNTVSEATNAPPEVTNTSPVLLNPRGRNLGVVLLTNRIETRIDLGDGKSCTIKPLSADAQHLHITMTLETKLADGKTRGLKIMSVLARTNQPFQVDFGSLALILTPQLATEPPPPAKNP